MTKFSGRQTNLGSGRSKIRVSEGPKMRSGTPKIGDFGETPDFKEIAPKREGSKNGGFGGKIGKIQKKDLFLGGPGGTF